MSDTREQVAAELENAGMYIARRIPDAWACCAECGSRVKRYAAACDAAARLLREPAVQPDTLLLNRLQDWIYSHESVCYRDESGKMVGAPPFSIHLGIQTLRAWIEAYHIERSTASAHKEET